MGRKNNQGKKTSKWSLLYIENICQWARIEREREICGGLCAYRDFILTRNTYIRYLCICESQIVVIFNQKNSKFKRNVYRGHNRTYVLHYRNAWIEDVMLFCHNRLRGYVFFPFIFLFPMLKMPIAKATWCVCLCVIA